MSRVEITIVATKGKLKAIIDDIDAGEFYKVDPKIMLEIRAQLQKVYETLDD